VGVAVAELEDDADDVALALAVLDEVADDDGSKMTSTRSVTGELAIVSLVSGDVATTTTVAVAITLGAPKGATASAVVGSSTTSRPVSSSIKKRPVTFVSAKKNAYVRPGSSKSRTESGNS
jgi:hypothetical protein